MTLRVGLHPVPGDQQYAISSKVFAPNISRMYGRIIGFKKPFEDEDWLAVFEEDKTRQEWHVRFDQWPDEWQPFILNQLVMYT